MARPIKHRGKWRIRWPDATGERQSEVYDDYKAAQVALSRHLAEVDEVRRGLRAPDPPKKTFDELCDLWEEKRIPQKRSGGNDLSVIRQLKKHFGGKMLRHIGIEDSDDYVDSRDDIEPKTIANHLTLLISMLNYAASLKVPWIHRVPDFKKPKIIVLGRDYRWLRDRLEFDEEADGAFHGPFREERDPTGNKTWGELCEDFPAWFARWRSLVESESTCADGDGDHEACNACGGRGLVRGEDTLYQATGIYGDGEPIYVNSYNEENLLDQTLLFAYFELRGGIGRGGRLASYVVLQVHGGCDVRGGYTRPRVFAVDDDDELAIFDYGRATIFCDGEPMHWWSTDDGRHWYAEGACGRGAGLQLETYDVVEEEVEHRHAESHPVIRVNDAGHGCCPICAERLLAATR